METVSRLAAVWERLRMTRLATSKVPTDENIAEFTMLLNLSLPLTQNEIDAQLLINRMFLSGKAAFVQFLRSSHLEHMILLTDCATIAFELLLETVVFINRGEGNFSYYVLRRGPPHKVDLRPDAALSYSLGVSRDPALGSSARGRTDFNRKPRESPRREKNRFVDNSRFNESRQFPQRGRGNTNRVQPVARPPSSDQEGGRLAPLPEEVCDQLLAELKSLGPITVEKKSSNPCLEELKSTEW